MNKSLVPILGKPFIDKLFITLDIPENLQQQVKDKFLEIFDNGSGKEFSHKSSYEFNLTISDNFPDYEGAASIHCCPKNTNSKSGDEAKKTTEDKIKKNFFRLVCNPARVDLDNMKTILDQILPEGYLGLLHKGKVNRLDLSVDVANMKVAEVIASYPKFQVAYTYGKGINSQAKYIGAAKSNKQICLYDKVVQMSEMVKKFPGAIPPDPKTPLTRIEMRLKKTNKTLLEIIAMPNPLKKLSLNAFLGSHSPKNSDPLWTLFLSACQDHGLKYAVAHFSKKDAASIKKRFENEGKSDWWKSAMLWKELQVAIKELFKVVGNAPKLTDLPHVSGDSHAFK